MRFFCIPLFTCSGAGNVKDVVIPPAVVLRAVAPEQKTITVPQNILNFSVHGNKSKFKKFCRENGLCIGCTYRHPKEPMFLSADGLNCPYCDADSDPMPPSPTSRNL